eukprot:gnl/Carplike_NY0171/5807_a7958_202.p1 GENE.gnl/Carplike_NY0171/5807_a7958_202~~gnl/Carplike_NY0171/5807_a7958_202.p1  ORF type:complete len:502 (-),score=94.34 gnl/Carplike_NY0171/5807_a7958_202:94-1599(-)
MQNGFLARALSESGIGDEDHVDASGGSIGIFGMPDTDERYVEAEDGGIPFDPMGYQYGQYPQYQYPNREYPQQIYTQTYPQQQYPYYYSIPDEPPDFPEEHDYRDDSTYYQNKRRFSGRESHTSSPIDIVRQLPRYSGPVQEYGGSTDDDSDVSIVRISPYSRHSVVQSQPRVSKYPQTSRPNIEDVSHATAAIQRMSKADKEERQEMTELGRALAGMKRRSTGQISEELSAESEMLPSEKIGQGSSTGDSIPVFSNPKPSVASFPSSSRVMAVQPSQPLPSVSSLPFFGSMTPISMTPGVSHISPLSTRFIASMPSLAIPHVPVVSPQSAVHISTMEDLDVMLSFLLQAVDTIVRKKRDGKISTASAHRFNIVSLAYLKELGGSLESSEAQSHGSAVQGGLTPSGRPGVPVPPPSQAKPTISTSYQSLRRFVSLMEKSTVDTTKKAVRSTFSQYQVDVMDCFVNSGVFRVLPETCDVVSRCCRVSSKQFRRFLNNKRARK